MSHFAPVGVAWLSGVRLNKGVFVLVVGFGFWGLELQGFRASDSGFRI